jgi:hypothetical protein
MHRYIQQLIEDFKLAEENPVEEIVRIVLLKSIVI